MLIRENHSKKSPKGQRLYRTQKNSSKEIANKLKIQYVLIKFSIVVFTIWKEFRRLITSSKSKMLTFITSDSFLSLNCTLQWMRSDYFCVVQGTKITCQETINLWRLNRPYVINLQLFSTLRTYFRHYKHNIPERQLQRIQSSSQNNTVFQLNSSLFCKHIFHKLLLIEISSVVHTQSNTDELVRNVYIELLFVLTSLDTKIGK